MRRNTPCISRRAVHYCAPLQLQINRATANNITGVLLPQFVIPAISGPVSPSGPSTWNEAAGALVSWRLIDFGQRAAKVDAAEQAAEAARALSDLTRLDVGTATLDAYLNVLAADALLETSKANVARLEAFGQSVGALVSNKLKAEVEQQQATAALALGRTQVIAAQANAASQRATLARLLGRPADDLQLAAPTLPTDAEGAIALRGGASDHPAAMAEAAKVRQEQARLSAVSRSYAPVVDAVGGAYTRRSNRGPIGEFGGGSGLDFSANNWAVGLQVTIPLGAYPAARAEQKAQRATVAAGQARYEATVREIDERNQQAKAGLHSAIEIAKVTPLALQAARTAELQQRARFQSSLVSAVDVTVAEAALAQAESQDAIARLNVWRALGAVAAAAGDLKPLRDALVHP